VSSCDDSALPPEGFATQAKLLLVEDFPPLQIRLRRYLETSGSIRIASIADSASTAMRTIDHEVFDVLIVDIELRAGNGIEVCRYARSHYCGGRQPLIIVLTNFALPLMEVRCRHAGADHFLDKMRQFQDLVPLIRQWRQRASGAAG
jgi:DNA-binding response OmpR family regulator